jgi:NADPH-dependent curcumin reductase CurA
MGDVLPSWFEADILFREIDARSYVPPVAIGEKMRGTAISRVLASKIDKVKEGDLVNANCGWTEVAILGAKEFDVVELPKGSKVTDALGVLGKFFPQSPWIAFVRPPPIGSVGGVGETVNLYES